MRRVEMRLFLTVCLTIFLFSPSCLPAAEVPFFNMSTVRHESVRLGTQTKSLVTKPFDVKNGGIWGTLAATGATAVAYIFDQDIRGNLADSRSSSLDSLTEAGSIVGNPFLHLGIAGAVYGGGVVAESARYRDLGLMLGEAAILADASTFVLKQAVGRARPLTDRGRDSFRPFQFGSDYDSFPSMHTSSSFAMASIVAGTSESMMVKVLSYSTALFVGFSRIYEDKHWASDVVMGAAVGELCGRVVMQSRVREGARVRITPLVAPNALLLSITSSW
ncbi:MAG: phosphoesterase [Nitrospirae bacterium GWC2_56_14]|nr:MAG: phosphoesterase [Nitrospirae bacterium GWC2_56_14]